MIAQTFLFIVFLGLPYFLPFFCAWAKNHPTKAAFFVANVFFGWTVIGWVVLLIMAANSKPVERTVTAPAVNRPPSQPALAKVKFQSAKPTGQRYNFSTQKWEAVEKP